MRWLCNPTCLFEVVRQHSKFLAKLNYEATPYSSVDSSIKKRYSGSDWVHVGSTPKPQLPILLSSLAQPGCWWTLSSRRLSKPHGIPSVLFFHCISRDVWQRSDASSAWRQSEGWCTLSSTAGTITATVLWPATWISRWTDGRQAVH